MSYLQMNEILQSIQNHCQQLRHRYAQHYEVAKDESVRCCLQRAMNHEDAVIKNLMLYRKNAPRHILNVWFQSPGVRQLREAIRIAEETVVQTLDDVVQMVVLCNNVVVAVCRGLGIHALSRDAKAVFEHLLEVRQQSRREQIWQAGRTA